MLGFQPESSQSASNVNNDLSSALLQLLPPGTRIPPLYDLVYQILRKWELSEEYARLGWAMRWVELGRILPEQLVPLLGERAAKSASALLSTRVGSSPPPHRDIEQACQLFTLTYLDQLACVVKIAELLAQLRHSPDADIVLSHQVITAAAHCCERLGMWQIRGELLDRRAQLDDPQLAQHALKLLEISEPARQNLFEALQQDLQALLLGRGLNPTIKRLPRYIYKELDEVHEQRRTPNVRPDAVLVVLEQTADCYVALGAINSTYRANGTLLRDYIGGPRDNGYQAIHTTINFKDPHSGQIMPVDIRLVTPEMERFNRSGYLAELMGVMPPLQQEVWWHDCSRWQASYDGSSSEMFVFTPKGNAIFLPRNATVLDFAVRIHRDLAVYCQGANLNGKRVGPGERLVSGYICEVLINQQGETVDQRLLAQVSTPFARTSIRRALQKAKTGAERGRDTLLKLLKKRLAEQEVFASPDQIDIELERISRNRNYHSIDAFFRAIVRGELAPDPILRIIINNLLIPRLELDTLPSEVRQRAERIQLALCCRPRPSQPAIAVPIHGGREIRVHQKGCCHINTPAYELEWNPNEQRAYAAEVLYECWDRPGLLYRFTGALNQIGGINIRKLVADVPEPRLARISFSFEAPSRQHLEQVQQMLDEMPERRHFAMSEITLIDNFRITSPLVNPYNPAPVSQRPFFVGRAHEIQEITSYVESPGARHILIRGPKRIGKSSLMNHLGQYYFKDHSIIGRLDFQSLPTEMLRFERLLERLAELLRQEAGTRGRIYHLDTAMLQRAPIDAFANFLDDIHNPTTSKRIIVLLDELGVLASRLLATGQESEFFEHWRALLNDPRVYERLVFIAVLPDHPVERMRRKAEQPLLRYGELGMQLPLSVLSDADARDLIESPVRDHLDYTPEDITLLLQETGGHPYYIHLVCSHIVNEIKIQRKRSGLRVHQRQTVPNSLIQEALQGVLHNDDAFHHLLADSTPETTSVLRAIATLSRSGDRLFPYSRISRLLERKHHGIDSSAIMAAVKERPDLLVEQDQMVGIRAALMARWLEREGI